ncbi:MAG: hypothetical protein H0U76_01745 [Ktedonobacteraceae bacterium]|nr:hypothetical protein [Ktedonobacteraceae bacterium]
MPTIGSDCELILDGTGYFIKPGSYLVKQPRIRHVSYRADGSLAYVDLGPGKRTWSMVVLARNELLRYDGALTGMTGQQYRDALRNSYTNNIGTTITYIDPLNGTGIAVHFDNYQESINDLQSQIVAAATSGSPSVSYEIAIELLEA